MVTGERKRARATRTFELAVETCRHVRGAAVGAGPMPAPLAHVTPLVATRLNHVAGVPSVRGRGQHGNAPAAPPCPNARAALGNNYVWPGAARRPHVTRDRARRFVMRYLVRLRDVTLFAALLTLIASISDFFSGDEGSDPAGTALIATGSTTIASGVGGLAFSGVRLKRAKRERQRLEPEIKSLRSALDSCIEQR